MLTSKEQMSRCFEEGVQVGRLLEARTYRNLQEAYVEELRTYTARVLSRRYPSEFRRLIAGFSGLIVEDLNGQPTSPWPKDKRAGCTLEFRNLLIPDEFGYWVEATGRLLFGPPQSPKNSLLTPASEETQLEVEQILDLLRDALIVANENISPTTVTLEYVHGLHSMFTYLCDRTQKLAAAVNEERSAVARSAPGSNEKSNETSAEQSLPDSQYGDFELRDNIIRRKHGKLNLEPPDEEWLAYRKLWYECLERAEPDLPAGGQPIVTVEEQRALWAIWHIEFDNLWGAENPAIRAFPSEKAMEEGIRKVKGRFNGKFSNWRSRPYKKRGRKTKKVDES